MNTRITGLAGFLAIAAATATATAGCAGGVVGRVVPSKPPTAAELLARSVPDERTGSFRYALKGSDLPATGVLDAGKHTLAMQISQKDPDLGFVMTMNVLMVEKRTWVKIAFTHTEGLTGVPKLPTTWMLLDPAKIKDTKNNLPIGYDGETDPGAAREIVEAAGGVQQTAPGHFAGTTDLTRQGEADIVDADRLTALGEKAKTVPFTATTDGKGRITSLILRIPAAGKAKAGTYEMTYRDYGTALIPAAPTGAQQQKAPPIAYDLLNG